MLTKITNRWKGTLPPEKWHLIQMRRRGLVTAQGHSEVRDSAGAYQPGL